MTVKIKPEDRDSVLFAFHEACTRPTAKQISEWVRRYPRFADDIRDYASAALELAMEDHEPKLEPDDSLLSRGYSYALNALYDADHPVVPSERDNTCEMTFHEIQVAAGTDVRRLARELDVSRGVLADLFNGCMLPPICKRLEEALLSKLSITRQQFNCAIKLAMGSPYLGHAKSDRPPKIIPRPCKQIIQEETSMTSERKNYWLEEG
jgi:hypothetical protein